MEPLISRLERARNISSHLVAALADLPESKEAASFRPRVEEMYKGLFAAHDALFRKLNPDFVAMEELSRRNKEKFDETEKQAAKVREETERMQREADARPKDIAEQPNQ